MNEYTEHEQEIVKALGFLAALWPTFKLTDATIRAYVAVLNDLPSELIQAAAEHLGSRSTFFPSASEIRKSVFELVDAVDPMPDAYTAWGEVMLQMSKTGSWGTPDWSWPIIGQAVDAIGGWKLICMSDNITADRARFVAAYDTLVNRMKGEAMILPGVRDRVKALTSGSNVQPAIQELVNKLRMPSTNDQKQLPAGDDGDNIYNLKARF